MRISLQLAIGWMAMAPVAVLATPILDVDSSGRLNGASNVEVSGSFYDVEFRLGDCRTLFDGCSESSFTFTTLAAANAASAALLEQVFIDSAIGNFDSRPDLTNGCTSIFLCAALTPYELGFGVRYSIAENSAYEFSDRLSRAESGFTLDRDDTVWTVWRASATPIPEPSALSLLVFGLLAFVCMSRRRRWRMQALRSSAPRRRS